MLPGGELLEQSDGTAWMAKFCLNMLEMALRLANHDRAYEDVALKFFEHFASIADRDERALGRGGRLLLRPPAPARRLDLPAAGALDGRAAAGLRGGGARRRRSGSGCRASARGPRWFIEQQAAASRASCATFADGRPARADRARRRAAAAARARPHARRERVPLALRTALALALPPRAPARRSTCDGREARLDYEPAESTQRALRRQLELARPGLVPAQLPRDRVAAASARRSRRRLHGRAADRLGRAGPPRRRSPDELERRLLRLFLLDARGPPPGVRASRAVPARPARGATSCSSTSTSTATRARVSAPRTRPAGPRSSRPWSRVAGGAWPRASARSDGAVGVP